MAWGPTDEDSPETPYHCKGSPAPSTPVTDESCEQGLSDGPGLIPFRSGTGNVGVPDRGDRDPLQW